jgi:ATP-dependent helicase/nuclease subunit B
LFNKLKKNLLVYLKNLINELVQSDFKDEYRELEMNGDSIKSPSALKFTLSNGSTISLNGVADRIDIYRKDDTAYIRVVDYKSGSDKTDIKNLSMGFGTQLFLYLLAICKLEKSEFRDKILMGAEKKLSGIKNIVPAGVMYFPMNMGKKNINYDIDFTNDNVNEKENIAIEEKIARSGYFLDEVDVISAQDKKQDGKILPRKDENPSSYIDRTKFDEIFDTIESTIKDIGNKILSGDASALPVANPNKSSKTSGSPCTYCEFKSICRNVKGVKD